jgi:hypothetical protein
MMRRLGFLVLAGVLCATWTAAAHAQWKWRDKAGQMHISDLPPPSDVAEKDVLQRPASARRPAPAPAIVPASAATEAAPAAAKPAETELDAKVKRQEQEKLAQQKKEEERVAAAKAENCKRAQEYLRTLDSGMRVARTNDKGEREILDDQQRAGETQRAKAIINSDCR